MVIVPSRGILKEFKELTNDDVDVDSTAKCYISGSQLGFNKTPLELLQYKCCHHGDSQVKVSYVWGCGIYTLLLY